MDDDKQLSRRSMLMKLGIFLNGAVAALLPVPVLQYLLSPVRGKSAEAYKSWVPLGALTEFPQGETRMATFRSPNARPWDGQTAGTACWVRHTAEQKVQVFA